MHKMLHSNALCIITLASITQRRRFTILTAVFCWSVKQPLPVAHTPNVDVHEVRAAIVSHSSALKAQGCVA